MIRLYHESDQSAVIDLVPGIQNGEYQLGLTLADQPDLMDIRANYRDKGGAFWVAEKTGVLVGCIGLMALSPEIGVLKKFSVASPFRGPKKGVSSAMYAALLTLASTRGLKALILDTPAAATRSHAFYRRAGFRPLAPEALSVPYAYPDRHSLLLMLRLDADLAGDDAGGGERRA